jgi:hypothetical protein
MYNGEGEQGCASARVSQSTGQMTEQRRLAKFEGVLRKSLPYFNSMILDTSNIK